jgi:hypothetical protein
VQRSLELGHIGLASHALRIEAAGGTHTLHPRQPSGTAVVVDVRDAARAPRRVTRLGLKEADSCPPIAAFLSL